MTTKNEFKILNGRYFPCLADCYLDLTLYVPIPSKRPFDAIEVYLDIPKALAIMGDKVHFFLDEENKVIYIRGYRPDADTQAPLWEAKYLDECISYAYDGCLGEENSEYVGQIAEFISRLCDKNTCFFMRHKLKGLYSYEAKTLIFYIDRDDHEKAKERFMASFNEQQTS